MQIASSWRRSAALVIAGAMVLAACGGEDDPADDATESETTAETPSETMTESDTGEESPTEEDTAAAGGEVATAEGVTAEPCPEAVNSDNGCIYLGIISDLTQGPFAAAGPSIVDAQIAFWQRVNEEGGIGGAYDVNVTEYVRDNLYTPETHNAVYQEIKPNILALAQSLGSPTTQSIVGDLESSNIVAAPASWTSANEFQAVILESGNNYCVESSNALDYHAEQGEAATSVLAVHTVGDYGWDGAAGAKKWADANGASFSAVEVTDNTDAAINAITTENPDVVVITLGPTQTGEVVGNAAGRGYTGRFIGNSPTWNPALSASAAGPAFEALYWQAAPWAPIETDTPGHNALNEQLEAMDEELENYDGSGAVSDFFTAGWAWSYPLRQALEDAYAAGDLTREGVAGAAGALESVDYEGMLPDEAGVFTGSAKEQSFNQTVIAAPDAESKSGVSLIQDFFEGPTAAEFPFDEPCYIEEGFAG